MREEAVNRKMLVDVPESLGAAMADRIIRGDPISDVLEMFVDEITTTAGVGTGTDTALGSPAAHKVQKAQRKKAAASYRKYRKMMMKMGRHKSERKTLDLYFSETGLGRGPRRVREALRKALREEGFKV